MGYTHYWDGAKDVTDKQWNGFCEDVKKILAESPVPIVRECDRTDEPPEVTPDLVAFNGPDEDGHETFHVDRDAVGFSFCKTARKPYDVVVVACCEAGKRRGVFTEWSSDGDPEDHFDGLTLLESVTE